jgi:hypothetical protein
MEMTREQVSQILSTAPYLSEPYWRVKAIESADAEFVPRLRELLDDPEERYQVQLAAAKALLRLGDAEFVERVAYSAEPRHPSTRVAAVRALGERYEPTPDAVQRTLHEVWKEGDMWYQDRQELKIHYLDYLRSAVQGVEDAIDALLALLDFQHEHPRVLERVVELLLQARGRDAAPIFAHAFEQCRDTITHALLYVRAIGRAGAPEYFEVIAGYPDYVRKAHPHAYTDALAAVIGAAGRMGQYEWLIQVGNRDLFSARTTWLRALGEIAQQQPQHRKEIVAILRRYLKPLDPTRSYEINWSVVPDRYLGHPPGAKVGEKEDDSIILHNTAVEVLRELGEEVEV